jgi:hypothetical protein
MRIYAFGAALGVLDSATALTEQSRIPKRNLTLINRASTYAHNDPNSAAPSNAFVNHLIPFLNKIRDWAGLRPRPPALPPSAPRACRCRR